MRKIVLWAEHSGYKIRFLCRNMHIWSDAAFLAYAEWYKGKADVSFIQISSGIVGYFNKGDQEVPCLNALNLIENPNSRSAQYGTQDGFERFYNNNKERVINFRNKSEKWFSTQRIDKNVIDKKKAGEFLNQLEQYKKEGKRVYLACSKLIFDLAVRYTKGCAHKDMSHWITHLVETVKKDKNTILLIKPHPVETNKNITMTSEKTDKLVDIIKTDLGKNIIVMETNLGIKNVELAQYLDLVLLWSGTSALEFQAMGVKCVLADECGYYDFPIGFKRFNSLKEYEEILNNPNTYKTANDLADRALMFLAYMGSDDLLVENPYTKVGLLNYSMFTGEVNLENIKKFNLEGNGKLTKLYDSVM